MHKCLLLLIALWTLESCQEWQSTLYLRAWHLGCTLSNAEPSSWRPTAGLAEAAENKNKALMYMSILHTQTHKDGAQRGYSIPTLSCVWVKRLKGQTTNFYGTYFFSATESLPVRVYNHGMVMWKTPWNSCSSNFSICDGYKVVYIVYTRDKTCCKQ